MGEPAEIPPQCAGSNHGRNGLVGSTDEEDEEWSVQAERQNSSMKMRGAIYRGKGPTGVSRSTSRANLVALFGLPLVEAAASLGVSTTIIKRLCRRHHIPRWPYRRLLSIDKQISRVRKEMEGSIDVKNKYLSFELRKLVVERDDIISCRFDGPESRSKGQAVDSDVKTKEGLLNQQNGVGPIHLKLPGPAVLPLRAPEDGNVSNLTSEQPKGVSSSSFSPPEKLQRYRTNPPLPMQLKVYGDNSDREEERVKECYSAAFRELALSMTSSYDQDSTTPTSGRRALDQLHTSFQELNKLPILSITASSFDGLPSTTSLYAPSPLPAEGIDLPYNDPSWSTGFNTTPRFVEDRISIAFPSSCIENLSPAPCIGLQSF